MKKYFFPLLCAILAVAGCEQPDDNDSLLIADGKELVPGAIETDLVADRMYLKSEYEKVVNHWEPVKKGDGASSVYYLFNGDHSLIILSKSDDKGDKSSNNTQLGQSEWTIEENGQTMIIEGIPYSVYPDSDYSFYLKAGERMLCFRTVSYALSLQKEIDEFLTAAVKVSSSNSGCGKETRSPGGEEQLCLKASPAGLVITHLNGTYNCGIKVAELQAEVILKGNDLRVLPFVEPAMKCLCPVDEAEITLDGLMKNREYVLYYKDFKPIQFRYTDTLDLTLDLAGYYPD